MRFGVPYKGSKNRIAAEIISRLPAADYFYDLFAGGCAVAHAALLSRKYKNIIVNDIDNDGITLFYNAVNGKYKDETRWISREDFYKLKAADPYIKLCWSFGNNSKDYLYSREIEPWKKALHYARVYNDNSLFLNFGIDTDGSGKDIKEHYYEYIAKYSAWQDGLKKGSAIKIASLGLESLQRLQSLQSLERLQSLESLQRLDGLLRFEMFSLDYTAVPIRGNSVIYCDIPYRNTSKYSMDFSHESFFEWARQMALRGYRLYISEYSAPPDFIPVWQKSIQQLYNSAGNKAGAAEEKLFVHKSQKDTMNTTDLFGNIIL